MKKTWILIADGAKAIILNYKGQGESLDQVGKLESKQGRMQDHEIGADKPGRSHESVGSSRSSVDSSDFQQAAKDHFAGEVADWLVKKQDEFTHLIIVAAPKTLGELRETLHKGKIQEKIIQEIDKDYTSIPEQDLGEHLDKILKIAI